MPLRHSHKYYNKGKRTPFAILFVVIPLYFTQGFLFPSGSIISQFLVFIWLIIDGYYFLDYLKKGERDKFAGIILLFLMLYTLNWMLSPKVVLGFLPTWGDWKNVLVVFLSYFPFRKLSLSYDSDKYFKTWALPITLACMISFYAKVTSFGERQDIANNYAYYFPVAFPLIGVYLKKKMHIAYAALYLVFVMAGLKRGAIICYFEELLVLVYFVTMANRKRKFWGMMSALLVLVALYYIVTQMLGSNEYLLARLNETMEGNSSGRDELYLLSWNTFANANIFNQLFGHGIDQSFTFVGNYAHSDWFELLIDLGLVGVFCYLLIFYRLFIIYHKHANRFSTSEKFIFVSIMLCWFTRSIFSMGFSSIEASFFMIGLAPIISKIK